MPIDLQRALAASLPTITGEWDEDDVILYHLGIGAGLPPTDPGELAYTYENGLVVLPTFSTIPAFPMISHSLALDGLDANPMMVLHGEHEIIIPAALPVESSVSHEGRVAGIYDKGKGALVVMEVESRDAEGKLLAINRPSLFIRGEGGFGGDPGPAATDVAPDRDPDLVFESPTVPNQALLYRLAGDKNPLHADPAFAGFAGFERPILHGLCSYGIVAKAVVDGPLAGDVGAVARYKARFSGAIYPGETIVTSVWEERGRWLIEASCKERGTPVVSNAVIEVHD